MSSSEFLNRNSSGKATDPLINFQVNIPEDDIWDNFVTGDRASSKPQPRPSESKTSPKKRRSKGSNVTRACGNCRKRNEECTYVGHTDGRKTAAKEYVEMLESRIKQLERERSTSSVEPTACPLTETSHLSPLNSTATTVQHEKSYQLSGEFTSAGNEFATHYGPTSALRHLPPVFMVTTEERLTTQHRGQGIETLTRQVLEASSQMLQLARPLDPMIHQTLLRVYFSYFADWCLWCDEAAFVAGLRASAETSQPLRSPDYSPFFHCTILAVTALHSKSIFPPEVDVTAIRSSLTTRAKEMMEGELGRPLTTTVKGLMLVGSVQFENAHRHVNLGWICEGMATRAAQILGLHIDCQDLVSSARMSQATKNYRDRTFYTVYIQDILWSFIVGRTASFHVEDFGVPLPTIDAEQDGAPWLSHRDRTQSGGNALATRPGWKSSTFHWTCRLICLADSIHQLLYTVRPRTTGMEETRDQSSRLNVKLGAWLVDLPIPLRLEAWGDFHVPPHILTMHATFHYLRILLHRPMYNRIKDDGQQSDVPVSVEICDTSADEVLNIVKLFIDSCDSLQFAPFLFSDIIFTVGTIYLLQIVRTEIQASTGEPRSSKTPSSPKLDKCLEILQELDWPAATNSRDSLLRMKAERLQPSTRNSSSSTDETGQSGNSINKADAQSLEAFLRNPSTEVIQILTNMGWKPPENPPPLVEEHSNPFSTGSDKGFESVDGQFSNMVNFNQMAWMDPIQYLLSGHYENHLEGNLIQSGDEVLSLGPSWGQAGSSSTLF